ncbi:sulfur carrier protein ThiS [Nocardioides piscis]|uniref:Sulfur carrier protein ThiS n=1 Tax=Nocardioides piscis TaxID=2714938 RepID=A0A6G7YKA1_9ACTN|nr:sulfur carrier protein ThiS [Nocardioides piscis]QIK77169.1 sulfur carrier protein ThiS [Nocardioides piscis]
MLIRLNGTPREVDAATLGELLGRLQTGCAVAVNGQVVRRGEVLHRVLREGDEVEVVTAVAGG